MSDSEKARIPVPDLTGFPTFVYVVDGLVAWVEVLHPNDERKIAILSSNPVMHVLEGGFPAHGIVPRVDTEWPI